LETGKITPVTTEAGSWRDIPAWSPDGSQIAVVRNSYDIFTVKPDGTQLKLISKSPERRRTKRHVVVIWSPDGKQIAFPVLGESITTYIVGVDGKSRIVLRNGTNIYPRVWSQDGRYIYGILDKFGQSALNQVVAVEVKTGKLTHLSEPINMAW